MHQHMRRTYLQLAGVVVVASLAACGAPIPGESVSTSDEPLIGDALSGLTAVQLAEFSDGKNQFVELETADRGLGPAFNDVSCGSCHTAGGIGGESARLVTRVGKITSGAFNPLVNEGGELLQANGVGRAVAGCTFLGEVVPADATVVVHRRTTALFGLGFVDVTTDDTLEDLAASEPVAIRGRVNKVFNISKNTVTVGKFGWKDQNPTLFQFSGDAYINEMGFTSPQFPNENLPQGNAGTLAACDTVLGLEDDGADVAAFNSFMRLLAPPSRGSSNNSVRAGDQLFTQLGCDGCHTRTLKTSNSSVAALAFKTYHPFSDFLLHDMGTLGDGIPDQGLASAREMRTAPLWGLRFFDQTALLHDGRAHSLTDAVLQHDGQGAVASKAFAALPSSDRNDLFAFLNSL